MRAPARDMNGAQQLSQVSSHGSDNVSLTLPALSFALFLALGAMATLSLSRHVVTRGTFDLTVPAT